MEPLLDHDPDGCRRQPEDEAREPWHVEPYSISRGGRVQVTVDERGLRGDDEGRNGREAAELSGDPLECENDQVRGRRRHEELIRLHVERCQNSREQYRLKQASDSAAF